MNGRKKTLSDIKLLRTTLTEFDDEVCDQNPDQVRVVVKWRLLYDLAMSVLAEHEKLLEDFAVVDKPNETESKGPPKYTFDDEVDEDGSDWGFDGSDWEYDDPSWQPGREGQPGGGGQGGETSSSPD